MLRLATYYVLVFWAAASTSENAFAAAAAHQCARPAWRPEACFQSVPAAWCYLLVPEFTGMMWALFIFTHIFLSFVVRSFFITANDYVYPKLFKESVSACVKLPLWMQEKYLAPWQATPIELSEYSLLTRGLFWITRIVGTIAIGFFLLTVLTYLLDRFSGCLSP